MMLNFIVHPACNNEVVGIIINIFKSKIDGLKYRVIHLKDYKYDDSSSKIIIAVANSWEEIVSLVTSQIVISRMQNVKWRLGLVIGCIPRPLTEMDTFRIFTMSAIMEMTDEIKGALLATEKEEENG